MKLIELTQGRKALVDDEDFEWLNEFNWHFHKKPGDSHGYARRNEKGKLRLMHTEVLKRHGKWIPGFQPDHRNGCGTDNRLENLRMATRAQNQANHRKRPDNRSGCPGVFWVKRDKRWRAAIRV